MKVLHVAPAFWPATRYGGPIVSVRQLCESLQASGIELDVVTTDIDGTGHLDVPTDDWTQVGALRVRYFRKTGRGNYCLSPQLWKHLARHASDYDLIHVTGTFTFPALAAGWAARRAGRPYVVSPRGNLQAWSLRQKRWKKLPYWYALERPHLAGAAAVHATADLEADAVRSVLPGSRVIVVPNGVAPVDVPAVPRRPRQLVFLGRIHTKKGIDILLEAASRLTLRWPDLQTVVAGPDDEGDWARLARGVERLEPRPAIRYVGSLDGPDKFRLLTESTVFVLPSHSENFGQAVVEALACGTPVVVSKNCPWRAVETEGAGHWVENGVSEVARAVDAILGATDGERAAMSDAARRLAARFSWDAIGRAMASHYADIVAERSRAAARGAAAS